MITPPNAEVLRVSGGEALGAVEQARLQGGTVYAETCTHYLAHDDTVFSRPDGWKFVIARPSGRATTAGTYGTGPRREPSPASGPTTVPTRSTRNPLIPRTTA